MSGWEVLGSILPFYSLKAFSFQDTQPPELPYATYYNVTQIYRLLRKWEDNLDEVACNRQILPVKLRSIHRGPGNTAGRGLTLVMVVTGYLFMHIGSWILGFQMEKYISCWYVLNVFSGFHTPIKYYIACRCITRVLQASEYHTISSMIQYRNKLP